MCSVLNAVSNLPNQLGFNKLTSSVSDYLNEHKQIDKLTLIANNFFRAAATYTLMNALPFSPLANFAISLSASLFYQLTLEERACQRKIAVLSCLGATALQYAVGQQVLTLFQQPLLRVAPLAVYVFTVLYVSHRAVEKPVPNNGLCLNCANA